MSGFSAAKIAKFAACQSQLVGAAKAHGILEAFQGGAGIDAAVGA
jgi:hypothetical protein